MALSGEGGDELFGGYYTYVADLLADRAGGLAPWPRPLVERLPTSTRAGELRLQGQALRPRRAPAAARAPPRVEGDLLRRRARRADRPAGRLRPGRPLPRALRRDRRRRAARAAAGRRPRHLPRRRPAGEDRPRVDGALARGAGAVPRPGRDELRARAAASPPGARAAQEGAAAQGGRAARPEPDRARQEARLLDPGRGVAARRARAVRARDAVAGLASPPGLLPARGREHAARPPRRRPGGPLPPALGPAGLHALARATRRAEPEALREPRLEALVH